MSEIIMSDKYHATGENNTAFNQAAETFVVERR